jgi:hypothetical protein
VAKKAKIKKRGVISYKSYLFVDKDPIIDAVRTAQANSGLSFEEIHAKGGATPSTLYGWFYKDVKRPQFTTVAATMLAMGKTTINLSNGKAKIE